MPIKIRFTFFSPWHMGSGLGEGAYLDALPVKTPSGLPYIPGRTVKGVLREAVQTAEDFKAVAPGTTVRLFGSRDKDLSRYETTPGLLRFSSATLEEISEEWAADEHNGQAVSGLYYPLASTKIGACGLADDKTLHKIEVTHPVPLVAEVTGDGDTSSWLAALEKALPLIRQIGSHRHRGLGRVQVTIEGGKS